MQKYFYFAQVPNFPVHSHTCVHTRLSSMFEFISLFPFILNCCWIRSRYSVNVCMLYFHGHQVAVNGVIIGIYQIRWGGDVEWSSAISMGANQILSKYFRKENAWSFGCWVAMNFIISLIYLYYYYYFMHILFFEPKLAPSPSPLSPSSPAPPPNYHHLKK